ncbi:ubiquinol--cytochrome-c reductase subunit 8 [Starmerella bacillaris]|uniref:Cytochrome b-c1 complex subunit 8 n=1 Tax=Starmerella bacillaris TaxID=1247836 RepID=A0AAV5RQF8_STABA|nr:ubiquinol--cytochrome-c reductase subunit 8 [Starmerella bacillaris]
MGLGGWWIAPKQKYTVRYGLAPNATSLFQRNIYNAFFNTIRRVKGQIFFVVLPVGSFWYLWTRATEYNKWLYTKDGRETLERLSA